VLSWGSGGEAWGSPGGRGTGPQMLDIPNFLDLVSQNFLIVFPYAKDGSPSPQKNLAPGTAILSDATYHRQGVRCVYVYRVCEKDSTDTDGCQSMCCGRGYTVETVVVKHHCDCKYYWCCYVKCKTCTKTVEISRCR